MADAIDELYDLPPGEFTAARDALVKQLRAEKQGDDAKAVKALRRPTVPAWAVNQVARRHPELVEALAAAGAALAAAQRRALSGVKDAGMRAAAATRREAVDAAWAGAAKILRGAGIEPAPHRQAVSDTFEAATADAEAADQVRAGRLSKEVPPPSGFGAVTGFSIVPNDRGAVREPAGSTAEDAEDPSAAAEEARRVAQHEAEVAQRRAAEAAQQLDALQRRSGDARQAAVRAAAESQRLEDRALQARQRASELHEQASRAEKAAADADLQLQRLVGEAEAATARADARASGQGRSGEWEP